MIEEAQMEYVTTYNDGIVPAVSCSNAMRTLEKYMNREGVETIYRAAAKHGFQVLAQADTLPAINMYVSTETMGKLLASNLITYICEYDKSYEEQCAELETHLEYPQDGREYWYMDWDNSWESVTTWEEIRAWVNEYRAQIGEENWNNHSSMLPFVVAYRGGYEVLAHGIELAPFTYAGTCGTYVTDETAVRMIVELGCNALLDCECEKTYMNECIAEYKIKNKPLSG